MSAINREKLNFRYTERFRGRRVPVIIRLGHLGRAVISAPVILKEWQSVLGKKRSSSKYAVKFLNDITNFSEGRALNLANNATAILRRRETKIYDYSRGNSKNEDSDQCRSLVAQLRLYGRVRISQFITQEEAETLFSEIQNFSGRCDISDRLYNSMGEWMIDDLAEPRFHTNQYDLLTHEKINRIAGSEVLLNVSRDYLGCAPILASVQSWTTRPITSGVTDPQVLDAAAMAYHCDSDYFGFLKVFILLTNVGPSNGPFTFVEKSHKAHRHVSGRMRDEEVVRPGDIEFFGEGVPGDVFIVDTRGWHKAGVPKNGIRTMLQFVYSTSLFGRTS